MKISVFPVVLALAITGCSVDKSTNQNTSLTIPETQNLQINTPSYPHTRQGDVVNEYFGTQIADPYRWLEDDRSAETGSWVVEQNKVTNTYLENIPFRDKLKNRLETLLNYEKVSAPFKEGKYTYFFKNDGLQNQAVLYRQLDDQPAQVFLDPNTFSAEGTTSLASVNFSKDGSLLTYLISEGGSDWRKAITIDVESKQERSSSLVDLKFSSISWLANEGFYYSSYDKPEGSELSAKTDQHKLYFHTIGSKQRDDILIFGGSEAEKNRYVYGEVTEDNRYLLISAAVSTSGNKLYIKDLTKPKSALVNILDDTRSDTDLLDSIGSKLLLITNLDAPNKRVIEVDASDPRPQNWQDFIPETENVLSATTGGGYIFAEYMIDAISNIQQINKNANIVREVTLPGVGSASGFSGKKEQNTLYYTFTNYKTPPTIFSLDVESGASSIYRKSDAKFDSEDYVSEQIFYSSKDGTQIPMIITHKKGLELKGENPTMLYGYGGLNISLQPQFSPVIAAWLEQGGVYAVANLRGGGEYGKTWHKAGIKQLKQNVFDDFIAAAEFLIEEKYTSPDYLAIRGGSNGGLLVAAVMVQRPELFKVALPAVGVLDMLRYHTFTAGAGWAYDYGTAEDNKDMFEYLLSYSPLHNVKSGLNYPATLITTGDHDDRVVPAHSFKFAAELQAKHTGNKAMLIRIETDAGHGAGTPISKTIEQYADIYGFTLFNMGLQAK